MYADIDGKWIYYWGTTSGYWQNYFYVIRFVKEDPTNNYQLYQAVRFEKDHHVVGYYDSIALPRGFEGWAPNQEDEHSVVLSVFGANK
jgi:hypothetical protein